MLLTRPQFSVSGSADVCDVLVHDCVGLFTYSLCLFAGLFSDTMGYCLPIVLCEMTKTKLLVLKDHIAST